VPPLANQGTLGSFFQGFRKDMITQGPNIVLKTVFDIACYDAYTMCTLTLCTHKFKSSQK
jgi:hypothetical protein